MEIIWNETKKIKQKLKTDVGLPELYAQKLSNSLKMISIDSLRPASQKRFNVNEFKR